MLKPSDTGDLAQTLFLDDMSVTEVSAQLNCPIIPVDDTDALVQQCCAPPLQSRSASLTARHWLLGTVLGHAKGADRLVQLTIHGLQSHFLVSYLEVD